MLGSTLLFGLANNNEGTKLLTTITCEEMSFDSVHGRFS
jgi:hypothetical protein